MGYICGHQAPETLCRCHPWAHPRAIRISLSLMITKLPRMHYRRDLPGRVVSWFASVHADHHNVCSGSGPSPSRSPDGSAESSMCVGSATRTQPLWRCTGGCSRGWGSRCQAPKKESRFRGWEGHQSRVEWVVEGQDTNRRCGYLAGLGCPIQNMGPPTKGAGGKHNRILIQYTNICITHTQMRKEIHIYGLHICRNPRKHVWGLALGSYIYIYIIYWGT